MECLPCTQIRKTWWSSKVRAPLGAGQKIEVASVSNSIDNSWMLSVTICYRKFDWLVDFEPYFDITPMIHSFKDSRVRPFEGMETVLTLSNEYLQKMPANRGSLKYESRLQLCDLIANSLLESIAAYQLKEIKALKVYSATLSFEIELLEAIPEKTFYLGPRDKDNQCLLSIEFPLLPYLQTSSDVEVQKVLSYLLNVQRLMNDTRDESILENEAYLPSFDIDGFNSIRFSRHVLISVEKGNIIKTEDKIFIPSSRYPCSCALDLGPLTIASKKPFSNSITIDIATGSSSSSSSSSYMNGITAYDVDMTHTTTVYDIGHHAFHAFVSRWNQRQLFIKELSCISVVLEFDAIDFSFVVIALRLRHELLCTVCTVEYRLPIGFPDNNAMPLMSVHDLQTGHSSVLDANVSGLSRRVQQLNQQLSSSPATTTITIAGGKMSGIAEACFSVAREFIRKQAFGE